MQSALQRLDDPGAGRRVTESDGQITQPAFVADAANCRALGVMQEFLLHSIANSLISVMLSSWCLGMKSVSWLGRAKRFQGQTSWQSSQP